MNKINPKNAPFALITAKSYLSVGIDEYKKYHYSHMQNIETPGKHRTENQLAHAIPSIMNLGFSLELLFKVNLFQNGVFAEGHKLSVLFGKLPAAAQSSINNKFIELYDADGEQLIELRINQQASSGPNISGYKNITEFLDEHNDVIVQWRYFYELVGSNTSHFFSFKAFIYAIRALEYEIENFNGNAQASIGT